jgi:hypothetical protein
MTIISPDVIPKAYGCAVAPRTFFTDHVVDSRPRDGPDPDNGFSGPISSWITWTEVGGDVLAVVHTAVIIVSEVTNATDVSFVDTRPPRKF